jgi:hypothetical protein
VNLTLQTRWERFEPDLPGNRLAEGEAPSSRRPFYFELAAGMTKEQFRALQRCLDEADDFPAPPKDETPAAMEARMAAQLAEECKRTAAALAPYVRFGQEPLTFDGEAVTTLEQYLLAVSRFQSPVYFVEPSTALARLNTLSGAQALFFERLSGGFASTASRRNGSQRAAR